MDGGAWWVTVHGIAKSRTWLSDFTFTFHSHALEKEMAIHSSVLAWRIRGTEEPGRLPSLGLHRVRHDWNDLAAAAAMPYGYGTGLFPRYFSLCLTMILTLSLLLQFSSVSQLCLTLCDPVDCSMPGFPVHLQLLEFTQAHVHSQWYHPTISFSVVPFSSFLQSFLASGSFQMSQFFASDGQSIGVSASVSVLPMNIHDWFPWGWTGWISLQSKGLSGVFSNTTVQKHQFFSTQLSL